MNARIVFALLMSCTMAASAQDQKPVFDPMNPPDVAPAKAAPKPAAAVPAPVAAPKTVAAVPVSAQAPTNTMAATAAVKPVAPVVPVGPHVVPYDELEGQVGKSIQIKTNLHTTRKGTLKRFNRAGLVIEDMSRGFAMNIDIPRSTVVEVTILN